MAEARTEKNASSANIGFEAKLWLAADKLRNNMDAAEYKHVVLGLIFLKYISDTFEEHRAKLLAGEGDYSGANPEDPDEYKAENVFWVPADARWSHLQSNAKQPTIGKIVDTYHSWLGLPSPSGRRVGDEGDPAAVMKYGDVPGFCKSATTEEIAGHSWVLTPGRYVGAEEVEDDGEPFEEKMPRLVAELNAQFAESAKLEQAIKRNLEGLGYAR
jgi:type I restriction-modification system DNA methylase subunit